MPEVAGTITKIEVPDEESKRPVKVSLVTDEGKPKTVSIFRRIPDASGEWGDNPALQAKQGDYGTFVGDFNTWTNRQNQPVKSFQATSFVPRTPPTPSPNGQTGTATDSTRTQHERPQPPTDDSSSFPAQQDPRLASFALAYSKDLISSHLEVHPEKSPNDDKVREEWFALADAALYWLREHS